MPKTPTKIFSKFKLLMILWHVYLIKILFNHCIEFELKETNLKKKELFKGGLMTELAMFKWWSEELSKREMKSKKKK